MSQTLTIKSPIDGRVVGELPLADEAGIEATLQKAREGFRAWKETSLEERLALCGRFIDALMADQAASADELTRQMGRPIRYTPKEIATAADRARTMMDLAPAGLADVEVEQSAAWGKYIRREPVGPVLVVPAWNYPYLIAVNSVVPALLAGNSVILKHSSQTALVAERIAAALDKAGLPAGVHNVVHTSHALTEKMVGDDRVAFVAFTGSVKGGHEMVRAAKDRFIGCGLELGGKDPAYVREDCAFDFTVENLVDGSFFNSGQSCCGIERIYVHRSLYDRFVEKFVALTNDYTLGDPLDEQTTLGPMAKQGQAEYVRDEIKKAVAAGATAHVDEKKFPLAQSGSHYCAPQVLTGVDHSMSVMTEETFGPVVGIMPVNDDDEAVRLMNDSVYGLTASVWTEDADAAVAIGNRVETGTFFQNRCDYLDPALAWVGVKDTGRGCTLSRLGYEQLTRPKSYHLRKQGAGS